MSFFIAPVTYVFDCLIGMAAKRLFTIEVVLYVLCLTLKLYGPPSENNNQYNGRINVIRWMTQRNKDELICCKL